MKLIGNYTSPFVRKISVILLEKCIDFEFINQSPWEEQSQVPRYNPLGKIPALHVSPQEIWFESAIIAQYLEHISGEPHLLPTEPLALLKVRQLEALADGVCEAAVIIVRHQMLPASQQSENELLRQRGKIERGLDALEQAAEQAEWLNGKQLNLADIATACTLSYLNFRHVLPGWCVGRPALVKQAETLFERKSFACTMPPAG